MPSTDGMTTGPIPFPKLNGSTGVITAATGTVIPAAITPDRQSGSTDPRRSGAVQTTVPVWFVVN